MNKLQELKKQIILAENKLDEILKERSEVAEFMTKNSVELFHNKELSKKMMDKEDEILAKQIKQQENLSKLNKKLAKLEK